MKTLNLVACSLGLLSMSAFADLRPESQYAFEKAQSVLTDLSVKRPNCHIVVGKIYPRHKGIVLPISINGNNYDIDANNLNFAYEEKLEPISILRFGKHSGQNINYRYAFSLDVVLDQNGKAISLTAFKATSLENGLSDDCSANP